MIAGRSCGSADARAYVKLCMDNQVDPAVPWESVQRRFHNYPNMALVEDVLEVLWLDNPDYSQPLVNDDGEWLCYRHPDNDRRQEETVKTYKQLIEQDSVNKNVGGTADTLPIDPVKYPGYPKDAVWLLGWAHRSEACKELWTDETTRNKPTVVAAIKNGIRYARKWSIDFPQDARAYIIDKGNSLHIGSGKSFVEKIQFGFRARDEFLVFKQSNTIDDASEEKIEVACGQNKQAFT